MNTPTIKELVVYVPAKDFAVSQAFYSALGFELTDAFGGTMDCRLGGAVFRLQDYFVKDWAHNFMMKFDVDDVQVWYDHAKAVLEQGSYGDARVSPPEMAGGTRIVHLIDPSGVLLIFVE